MKPRRSLLLGALALGCLPVGYAVADYLATPGGTLTVFAFVCQATKACPASVPITSAGVELMTAAQPAQVSLANTGANATALNVAGSLTNISGTISLPTGASTLAAQNTGNTSLGTIATNTTGASTAALQGTGNTTLSTIATNTTGAATAANQTTGNASLATIATNTAASVPTLQGPTTGGTPTALISCNAHTFLHITTAASTPMVNFSGTQTIYVCGWRSRAAGVATWQLGEPTAASTNTCGTPTALNGLATEAANTGEVMNPAFWSGLKGTAGHALCVTSTGTGGVDVDLWYTQF